MGPPSAHGRRGRGPWQGLLLAASLLTFDIPRLTAKPTIESEPLDAAEGQDVILRVCNLPEHYGIYSWYKGGNVDSSQRIASYNVAMEEVLNGPAHSGREIMYPNISLLFQNVTQNDTGDYTLRYTNRRHVTKEITGQICVYLLPKPHITSNNLDPVEHEDTVVLTCGPETPDTTYLWSINSQSLPDSNRLQLSKDNRTLTLLHVTRTDTGPYVCETRNPFCARCSDPLTLNVLYGPDNPIISPPQPYYPPGAVLSLSCHAVSNPPAQYYWLINGKPQKSTQELFIPNITESDCGSYTCLAHNNATGLNSTTVKTIMVSEPVAPPSIQASSTTVTEHKDPVVLTCLTRDTGISILWLLNNQHLRLTYRMMLSQDNSSLTISPVRREDAGEYQCEVSNLVSSSRSDPLTLTVKTGGDTTGLTAGVTAAIVIGVVLAAALGCILVCRSSGSVKRGFPKHRPPAPAPGAAPSGCSVSSASQLDIKPDVPIYEELLHPDTGIYCQIIPRAQEA